MTQPYHDAFPVNHETGLPPANFLETDLQPWRSRMESLAKQGAIIIALHGAGSATGIKPKVAESMASLLEDYVSLRADGRTVVLISDGDHDNRQYPDVGAVFGMLADRFVDESNVIPIAVQTTEWYRPKTPGAALCSDKGTPYETYIFNKDMPEIGGHLSGRAQAHSALSQSDALVAYPFYEQVVLGAAGSATVNQLHDLSRRASERGAGAKPVSVTIVAAHNNPALKERLEARLGDPDPARDEITRKKLARHASSPYGLLCTITGEPALAGYPGLSFSFQLIE
ncbi:MAG TPA: hypothetical protein VLG16_04645 [Candidatus Saccharimonadales bacterium]|nr:hypothetical protein [Candidatus Saccharimonadales bacterium]